MELSEIYEKPQNGVNLTLTINYELQETLERELDTTMKKYNPDQALGLIMDPNSGEILAISSRPNFSPSHYKNYTVEETSRNLPVWSTYEPGSTFKIITLATALQENKINLEKDTFQDNGSIQVENARIKCWKRGGHGSQTFLQVVENSCNLGIDTETHTKKYRINIYIFYLSFISSKFSAIIYLGLAFTSLYIFPTYSPIIPILII